MSGDTNVPTRPIISKQDLFARYRGALIPIIAVDARGDEHIGSAFHIGDGVFISARHVIEGATRCYTPVALDNKFGAHNSAFEAPNDQRVIEAEVLGAYHPDERIDVACFALANLAHLDRVDLGGHLDDWLSEYAFVLDDILVLGFPPIPLTQNIVLLASHGHINAQVDLITAPHVHFIVSVTARGGMSGGLVLHESGFAMGVVTSSLVRNGAPEEMGYLTVLTVEPILVCLAANNLMPRDLADFWSGLFTKKEYYYGKPDKRWAQGWIGVDRGGTRAIFEIACPCEDTVSACIDALKRLFREIDFEYKIRSVDIHRFKLEQEVVGLEEALETALTTVESIFVENGFLRVENPIITFRSMEEPISF